MERIHRVAVAGATGRVGRHVVDVLCERGYEVIRMSRASDVDVISGFGLDEALRGVDAIVDAATGPSSEEVAATQFFTTAARNLQTFGHQAGAVRLVVVSIIGCDRFTGGYGAAKVAHEQAALAGPVPARIVRAAQFHEFVEQLMEWGRRGDTVYVPQMRTQLVAARAVAEAIADVATGSVDEVTEVAGPLEESLAACARVLSARRGDGLRIEEVSDPSDSDHALYLGGGLLPGAGARLAGPTFEAWLNATVPMATSAAA
jgi:uncharacterized protein YbjT (DUF2867 family)